MKLNFAIICDNAFADIGRRLSIIQTFDEIIVPGFPAIHPRMTVITSYAPERSDPVNKEYTQLITIQQKDTEKEIAKLSSKNRLNVGIRNVQFIAYFVGLKFDQEGQYEIKIKMGQKEYPSIFFAVRKESP